MTRPVLEVSDLVAGYEPGVPIVRSASIRVDPGEIVVVLGPNGAGKSSFIKAIAGLVPVSGGTVLLDGDDITTLPAHQMVRRGLAFVPQTENIFPQMSVEDNLRTAGGSSSRSCWCWTSPRPASRQSSSPWSSRCSATSDARA
jgi:branched-chain amino acid transport system ATP-binding protein